MTSDNAGFHYSDFKPVVPRKKRTNKVQIERPSLLTQVQRAGGELAKDDWNARCQQILQEHSTVHDLPPLQILCLGLGSPSSSPNSRAQLAFLLEICKATGIGHTKVSIYDPVFSEEDVALFEELGFWVLSENQSRHLLDAPTILWMPHCDLELYESVLAANWSREQLEYMILISNRLGDYVVSNPKRKLETRAPRVLQLEDVMQCTLLPVCPAFPTAFNTIAIHSIGRLARLSESWFAEIVKPPHTTDGE
ncbi:Translation machinery-associated protein 20 [Mycena venus]|uniref:Translation machinery-associated protein 20 n=1 Tax=Mycena venus TaxID=2733690 RepID=A0A8H6XDA5_9AGAR|nr:Translation machinery-associated protein 20 [Mycena venus]